jgi:excisionase family DNA binding protein
VERVSFRVREFSAMTGIPPSTTHDLIRRGELHAVQVGRLILITKQEVDRFLAGGKS